MNSIIVILGRYTACPSFNLQNVIWYMLVKKRNAALHFANFSVAKLDAALDLVGYSNSKGITGEETPSFSVLPSFSMGVSF